MTDTELEQQTLEEARIMVYSVRFFDQPSCQQITQSGIQILKHLMSSSDIPKTNPLPCMDNWIDTDKHH